MLDLAQMRETIPLVQLCDSASRVQHSELAKGCNPPLKHVSSEEVLRI